jgi:hypothetical protein
MVIIAAGLMGNAFGTYVFGGPRVGSIIAFEPSAKVDSGPGIRVAVDRDDRTVCTLDLSAIRRSGGSLVIETGLAGQDALFRVHWAGGRTSDDGADCGRDANLTVARKHLDLLASYAGGYGAGPDRQPLLATARLQ